jgi:hypothetical protein
VKVNYLPIGFNLHPLTLGTKAMWDMPTLEKVFTTPIFGIIYKPRLVER